MPNRVGAGAVLGWVGTLASPWRLIDKMPNRVGTLASPWWNSFSGQSFSMDKCEGERGGDAYVALAEQHLLSTYPNVSVRSRPIILSEKCHPALPIVILSEAKDLARCAERCFAILIHGSA